METKILALRLLKNKVVVLVFVLPKKALICVLNLTKQFREFQ